MIEYKEIESDDLTFYDEATKFLKIVASELGLSDIDSIYAYIRNGKSDIDKFYEFMNKKLDEFIKTGKLNSWKKLHSDDSLNNLGSMIFLSDYMRELMCVCFGRNISSSLNYMTDYAFEIYKVFSTLDGSKFENPYKYNESVKTRFAYDEKRRYM